MSSRWVRHFVYRAEQTRTTWPFRVGVLAALVLGVWLTSGWWTVSLGRSLVCDASVAPSDAILIENFDPDYLLFQRARQLRRAGAASRVLVPIRTDRGTAAFNDVALGIAEVMARISRIGPVEFIPTLEAEPYALNAARDVLRYARREEIHSVIVVTPLFRSRRSSLVYAEILTRAGVEVRCQPVQGSRGVDSWTKSWHGLQEVAEQWLKLQYYRLYVLPVLSRQQEPHP